MAAKQEEDKQAWIEEDSPLDGVRTFRHPQGDELTKKGKVRAKVKTAKIKGEVPTR